METKATIDPAVFWSCDIRVGHILSAEPLENARRPAFVLNIDFGPLGVLKSTAQLTERYKADELVGKCIVAVVNLPVKQVGSHQSRCLVLGAVDDQGVHLLEVPLKSPPGTPVS
jgi:tRNA-binding protein